MVSPSRRRGAGSFGCLLTIAVLLCIGYLGVAFGRPYFRYRQFKDEMDSAARFAGILDDAAIQKRVVARADSLGLPPQAKRISVRRLDNPARIVIEARYSETVRLPLLEPKVLQFAPRSEAGL